MILLVEDEERYREHIARVLTKAGYEVLQAADGLEALSTLEKSKIDLVISDILMPNLNGYALVARLRAKWPKMPVILTTGFLSAGGCENYDERLSGFYSEAHQCRDIIRHDPA